MILSEYKEFINSKIKKAKPIGFSPESLNKELFDFQEAITRWTIKKGRAAIFAGTGLGKTLMQLSWANEYYKYTGKPVIIFAPLSVSHQTKREGDKFHVDIPHEVVTCDSDIIDGINITNYEKLHNFKDPSKFGAIVIDESSILKGFDGKFRKAITDFASGINYRLACTATPAPNDYMEIGLHSEFLGVMSYFEMLSMYFTHDGGETQKWVVKKHGEKVFWEWVCSWACCIRTPSDLGFDDSAYILPPLNMYDIKVEADPYDGMLFPTMATTLTDRIKARKGTIEKRCDEAIKIVNNSEDQWVVWCNLNDESKYLKQNIKDSVEVKGSDPDHKKEEAADGFVNGKYRVIISKPSIFGFGINWQHCSHMCYVGLTDSFEQIFQSQRRLWRFGQTKPVECYIVSADVEEAVVENIKRKEDQFHNMVDHMVEYMKEEMQKEIVGNKQYIPDFNETMEIPNWLKSENN